MNTDHILFIAAGAFHLSKPSDLFPELQGRFPLRAELEALGKEEFYRILTEPHNSLTRQYEAMLETEGVRIEFTDDGLREIAAFAEDVNTRTENTGRGGCTRSWKKSLPTFRSTPRKRGAARWSSTASMWSPSLPMCAPMRN